MSADFSFFKELHYLVTIAEEGSLTKASEKLYISQPSLSFFLKETERKIGVKLFARIKTGLVPTAAGEIAISAGKRIIAEWEDTVNLIQKSASADRYIFATPAFRGTIILPSLLVDLQNVFPDVNFGFEEILTRNVAAAFEEKKIDAALMVDKTMKGERFSNQKIINEEIILVGNETHSFYTEVHNDSNKLWIEPETLNKYDVVVLQPGHQLRKKTDSFFQEKGIHPRKVVETSNIVTLIRMAESGIGIAFLPMMFLLQCSCLPVSIGEKGLFWPVYLTTRSDSNPLIGATILNSIKKTYSQQLKVV